MAKKKNSKRKKRTPKKQSSLTHLEKEILNQTIADLKDKIKWRSELCDIIKQDIEEYENAYELEYQDKKNCIDLLEKAIEDVLEKHYKIKSDIPDAKNLKLKAEEIRSRDTAARIMEFNEETLSNEAELKGMREKVVNLEHYDEEFIDNKIKALEEKMDNSESNDDVRNAAVEEKINRILRLEMQEIHHKKIFSYQSQLKGKMSKSLERIMEETRWWRHSWQTLLNKLNNLKQTNKIEASNLARLRIDIQNRKGVVLLDSVDLCKQKSNIASFERRMKSFKGTEIRHTAKKWESADSLHTSLSKLESHVVARKADLKQYYNLLEKNESCIKELESDVKYANDFAGILSSIIKEAASLIENEIKYCHESDPSDKTDTLLQLDGLLAKASKLVYEKIYQI